jgi:hypothetical protein
MFSFIKCRTSVAPTIAGHKEYPQNKMATKAAPVAGQI